MRITLAVVVCALFLPGHGNARTRGYLKQIKKSWDRQVQVLGARKAQIVKTRRVKSLHAKRQRFHRTQARQFNKDFNAWAKDPRIKSIYRQQQKALGLGNLKYRFGISTGMTGVASLSTLSALITGGNAAGPLLATIFLGTLAPDGSQIPVKARQARLATLVQARAQGHTVPKALLPVFSRDLRIARMKAGRTIRDLQGQLRSAEVDLSTANGRLNQTRPLLGNIRLIGQ